MHFGNERERTNIRVKVENLPLNSFIGDKLGVFRDKDCDTESHNIWSKYQFLTLKSWKKIVVDICLVSIMCVIINVSEARSFDCSGPSCKRYGTVTQTTSFEGLSYRINRNESCKNIKGWWFCDMPQNNNYTRSSKRALKKSNKRDRKRRRYSTQTNDPRNKYSETFDKQPSKFILTKDSFVTEDKIIHNDTLWRAFLEDGNHTSNEDLDSNPDYLIRARLEEENISYRRLKAEVTLLKLSPNTHDRALKTQINEHEVTSKPQDSTLNMSPLTTATFANKIRPETDSSLENLVKHTQLIIVAKLEAISNHQYSGRELSQPSVKRSNPRYDPIMTKLKVWANHDEGLLNKLDTFRKRMVEEYDPIRGHHYLVNYNRNYSRLSYYDIQPQTVPNNDYIRSTRNHSELLFNSQISREKSGRNLNSPILPYKIIPQKILKGPKGIAKQVLGKTLFITWRPKGHLNPIDPNTGAFSRQFLSGTPHEQNLTTYFMNNDSNRQNKFILFLEPYRKEQTKSNIVVPIPLNLFYLHSHPFVSTPKIRRQIRKLHFKTSHMCTNPKFRKSIRLSVANPKFMRVLHDNTLVLSCLINNRKATAKVKWYKNGRKLTPFPIGANNQIMTIVQEKNVSTLRIYHVKLKNSGIYHCQTRTFCGHNIASSNITVEIYRRAKYQDTYQSLFDSEAFDDRIIGAEINKPNNLNCQYNMCANGGTCVKSEGEHKCDVETFMNETIRLSPNDLIFEVRLKGSGPYGFRVNGGKEGIPMTVSKVRRRGKAHNLLLVGDKILYIDGLKVGDMMFEEALNKLDNDYSQSLNLTICRNEPLPKSLDDPAMKMAMIEHTHLVTKFPQILSNQATSSRAQNIEATMIVTVLPRTPKVKILRDTSKSGRKITRDRDFLQQYVTKMIKSLIAQSLTSIISNAEQRNATQPCHNNKITERFDEKYQLTPTGHNEEIINMDIIQVEKNESTPVIAAKRTLVEASNAPKVEYHMYIMNGKKEVLLNQDVNADEIYVRDSSKREDKAISAIPNEMNFSRGRKVSIDASMQTDPYDFHNFLSEREKRLINLLSENETLVSTLKLMDPLKHSTREASRKKSSSGEGQNMQGEIPGDKKLEEQSQKLDILAQLMYKVDNTLIKPCPRKQSKDVTELIPQSTNGLFNFPRLQDVALINSVEDRTLKTIRYPNDPHKLQDSLTHEDFKRHSIPSTGAVKDNNFNTGGLRYAEVTLGKGVPKINSSSLSRSNNMARSTDNFKRGKIRRDVWLESLQEFYPSSLETKLISISGPRLYGDLYEKREHGRERILDPLTGKEMSASFMAESTWANAIKENPYDGSTTRCMSSSFICTRSIQDLAMDTHFSPKERSQFKIETRTENRNPCKLDSDNFPNHYLYKPCESYETYRNGQDNSSHLKRKSSETKQQKFAFEPRAHQNYLTMNKIVDPINTIKMTTSSQGYDFDNKDFGCKQVTSPKQKLTDFYLKATSRPSITSISNSQENYNSPIPWQQLFKNRKISNGCANNVAQPFLPNRTVPMVNGHKYNGSSKNSMQTSDRMEMNGDKQPNQVKNHQTYQNFDKSEPVTHQPKLNKQTYNGNKSFDLPRDGCGESNNGDVAHSQNSWPAKSHNGIDLKNDSMTRSMTHTSPSKSLIIPQNSPDTLDHQNAIQKKFITESKDIINESCDSTIASTRRPSLLNLAPSVKEQIDISHKIANSLSSPENTNKASMMFMKRAEKAKNWEKIAYGGETEYANTYNRKSVGNERRSSFYDENRYETFSPTGIPKYASDPRHLVGSPLQTRYPDSSICTHDKVSPDLCKSIVNDLHKGFTSQRHADRGAQIFANRRQKSNDWVVDSTITKEECMDLPSRRLDKSNQQSAAYGKHWDSTYIPQYPKYETFHDSDRSRYNPSTVDRINHTSLWDGNATVDNSKMRFKNFNTLPRSWKPVKENFLSNGHVKDAFGTYSGNQSEINKANQYQNDREELRRLNDDRTYRDTNYGISTFF